MALVIRGVAAQPGDGYGERERRTGAGSRCASGAPGFRPITVTAIEQACADVLSLTLQDTSGQPLQTALPGQYVVLRLPGLTGGPPLFRSYSLSGAASTERYRISVKIEPNGAAGTYLQKHVHLGDALDVSAPRGSFVLQPGDGPLVRASASARILTRLVTCRGPRSTSLACRDERIFTSAAQRASWRT